MADTIVKRAISLCGPLTRPLRHRCGLLKPKVGVACIIFNGAYVLLGRRTGSDVGSGSWQVSGGHLEFDETFEECAEREVKEETNLRLKNVHVLKVTNNIYRQVRKHYVTVRLAADVVNPDHLKVMEEDKCEEWTWFLPSQLPSPIFEGSGVITESFLSAIHTRV
jgi:8-oxo-dGTP diphosphatase